MQTQKMEHSNEILCLDVQKYTKASAHQQEWGEKLIPELDLKGTEPILDQKPKTHSEILWQIEWSKKQNKKMADGLKRLEESMCLQKSKRL